MQHVQEHQRQKRNHRLLVCELQSNQGDQEPGAQLQNTQREFHGNAGFCHLVQLTHITEKMEPKMMMKAGLKTGSLTQALSTPRFRLTFRSANRVSEVPACSKHAQKTVLMIIKMMSAIIRPATWRLFYACLYHRICDVDEQACEQVCHPLILADKEIAQGNQRKGSNGNGLHIFSGPMGFIPSSVMSNPEAAL